MTKSKHTCNQCHKDMKGGLHFDLDYEQSFTLRACVNPKCPNFGLLQIPVEQINENSKK